MRALYQGFIVPELQRGIPVKILGFYGIYIQTQFNPFVAHIAYRETGNRCNAGGRRKRKGEQKIENTFIVIGSFE
jgi:hypothetical protein